MAPTRKVKETAKKKSSVKGSDKKKSDKKEAAKKKKKSYKSSSCGAVVKKKRQEKSYSLENLQAALDAVSEGQTLRQAAYDFGVPKSTLYLKSKNQVPLDCRKGPKTVLSVEAEKEIEQWLIFCAYNGFAATKSRLLDCVQKYILSEKTETPFKNSRPGQHWYHAFMRRHPNLSNRIAQNLTSTRAAVTEKELRDWFAKVKKYLEEKNLLSIEPERIFNLDESAFMLVPKDNKVITEKGTRAPYQIVSANEKASLTVLFTVAASGVMPPPMILFDLKTSPKRSTLNAIPKGWGVGNTDRGWMTAESFYSYISNVFYKWLKENNYTFPIILYVDGHSSHITLPLLKFCKENQIELIILYPNATHIIQPLDVAIFHPLKEAYRKVLRQWRIDNNIVDFKKHMFAPVLKMALDSQDFSQAIKNGFRTCGLYPYDANAVNYNILSKKSKKNSSGELDSNSVNPKNDAKNAELLAVFEKNLVPSAVLQLFKEAELEDKWNGDLSYEALFESWRKLRKLCSAESAMTDNLTPVDEEILIDDDNLNERMATDTTPGTADDTMLDSSICIDQQDLSLMDMVDTSSDTRITETVETEWPAPEVELYDEEGHRITATLVEIIKGDVSIKAENIKENIGALKEQLNKLNSELAALENSIVLEEMQFLQTKIKIKKEKCDNIA